MQTGVELEVIIGNCQC